MYHRPIEVPKVVVEEFAIVGKTPLTTGIVVRPAVALSGEIDPLGMSKFVPHEG